MKKLLIAALLAVVACAEKTSGPPKPPQPDPPVLTTLVVEATDISLQVGETATLSAKGRDQYGNSIALSSSPTYVVSPTNVATISGNVVTAANPGSATVTATVETVSGSLAITVSERGVPPRQPEATAKGAPVGRAVTKSIGPGGGSLTSGDGVLTLVVPAGAVAAATELGIQPITNTAHGGLRMAYRLTPEGQSFQKPVELAFQYSDADHNHTSPDGLGVAFQDERGFWQSVNAVNVDRMAQSLSVSTDHLSDWTYFKMFFLEPHFATVKVGQAFDLSVIVCVYGVLEELTTPVAPNCRLSSFFTEAHIAYPTVNGIGNEFDRGGDATVGTVRMRWSPEEGTRLIYTAPDKKPPSNPVAVSVQVNLSLPPMGSAPKAKGLLVSNIEVVDTDAWAGTIEMEITSSSELGTGRIQTRADVAFELDEQTGGYVASGGHVSVHDVFNSKNREPPCQTTISGGATIKRGEGSLVFFEFANEPKYLVDGYSIFTSSGTTTCNDGNVPEEVVDPVGARWAGSGPRVRPEGDIIDDTVTTPTPDGTITHRIRLKRVPRGSQP